MVQCWLYLAMAMVNEGHDQIMAGNPCQSHPRQRLMDVNGQWLIRSHPSYQWSTLIDIRPPKYPGWEFGKFRQRLEGPGVYKGWIFWQTERNHRDLAIQTCAVSWSCQWKYRWHKTRYCTLIVAYIHIHGWELILYLNPTNAKQGYSSHGREPDHEKPLDIEGLEWE